MNKYVHLSLSKKETIVKFEVVQYSTLPFITFVLDDYMPASGCAASLYIEKPDGTKIYNACTVADNLITYEPTTQSFAVLGINHAQLHLVEPNGAAISFLMHIEVTKNIIDSSAIESQDEFTALEEALQTVSQYDTRITDNTNRISVIEPLANNAVLHNDTKGLVTLNGNITIKKVEPTIKFTNSETTANSSITVFPSNQFGNNFVLSSGGNTVIGGGEYALSRYNESLVGDTSENLYLGADTDVYIETNANTITNAKRWTFNAAGKLISPVGSVVTMGGANTTRLEFWSNATNKVGFLAGNNVDNKTYELLAKEDRFRLYNVSESKTIWDICQNDVLYNTSPPDNLVTTVPNATWTTVGSFKASLPGIYLILVCIRWNSNAKGFRKMIITTDPDSTTALAVQLSDYVQAANGDMSMTNANGTYSIKDVSTKFYVRAYQNSGGNLTAAPRLSLVRLHAL